MKCPRELHEESNDDCENVTDLSNCYHGRSSTKVIMIYYDYCFQMYLEKQGFAHLEG